MPRHLPADSIASVLTRGVPVEQFLGRHEEDGAPRIAWVEIRASSGRYEIRRFDIEDRGSSDSADVYEWLDGDAEPETFSFETPEEAIGFAAANLGACRRRWVNQGLVQEEYLDAISVSPNIST